MRRQRWKMKNTSYAHSYLRVRVREIMVEKEIVVEYVRGTPPDRWHWCKNCSQYPLVAYQRRSTKPDSDLCDECERKENKNECTY
jgi:hypothetical protein